MAEAFNSLFKAALIRHQGPWRDINDVKIATVKNIDWFNHRSVHGEIGPIPPAELETAHAAGRQPATVSATAGTSQLSLY